MWLLWTQHWCGIVDITTCSQLSIIQYVGLYFQFTHFACDNWQNIYILCFIIIIKSEVWTITHCLGLGNETMVCAVCLSVFLQHGWCGCRYRDSNNAWKIMDRFAQCKVIWKFTYICVYSLRRFSDTGIIMTSQRCCHARDSQNQAQIFYNARFATACLGNWLAEFGFVVYENELIHVIIGFKHDIPRVVRSRALRGHSDTSVHSALRISNTDWSSWPLRASDLTMHGTITLKSFNNNFVVNL